MVYKYLLACLLFILLLQQGCLSTPKPQNSTNDYLKTISGGFLINTQLKTIRYGLNIQIMSPIPKGSYLVTHFENPLNPNDSIKLTTSIPDNANQIVLKSSEINGLKPHHKYYIKSILYTQNGIPIDTHSQYIESLINQKDL